MLNSFPCMIANIVCDFAFLKNFHAFLCLPDKWEGEPCGLTSHVSTTGRQHGVYVSIFSVIVT